MKKSQEIIGLPVFSIIDGMKLGRVEELVINPEAGKVDFILISNGNRYADARVLPYNFVMGVGADAVTTESEKQLSSINENTSAANLIMKNISVKGNRVLTNKGNLIGIVSEYEIDEQNGKITQLEYKTIPDESQIEVIQAENVVTYGLDVIVIKEMTGTDSKFVQDADTSKDTPLYSDSTSLFKERQKQYLLGKKVIQDIKDADGVVIIPEGTIVTEEICNIAENKGKFVELSQCTK